MITSRAHSAYTSGSVSRSTYTAIGAPVRLRLRSRINRARLVNLRARFVLRPDLLPRPRPGSALRLWTKSKKLIRSRRSAEHCDRRSYLHRVVKCDRQLIGHSHTAVRRRITRQITGVHSVRAMKAHEVRHRRRNEFAPARNVHVHVGVSDHRASARVHNLPVDARVMTPLFLDHFERAGLGEMAVTAARDRRFHHRPPPAD